MNNFSSGGSIENFNKISDDSSSVNLAFVQYDVLLYMQLRNSDVKDKLELVLPMYAEEVHLVTRKASGVNSVEDLAGKIVAGGSKSQGTSITTSLIMSTLDIECEIIDVAFKDAFAALLDEKIDAFFYVGGAPVEKLLNFPEEVRSLIKLVPIENESLLEIYSPATIKAGTYPWLKTDIKTIYVQSFLVANNTKEMEVTKFLEVINKNLDTIKKDKNSHPKWSEVTMNAKFPDWPVNKESSQFVKQNK